MHIFVEDSPTMHRLFIFISILATFQLTAQDEVVSLQHYSTSEGLSDNNVRCMLVDARGFIWIGTDDGLNRFDGIEFVTFRRNGGGKFSLSGNIITDIQQATDGTLWVATRDGGICQFNPETGEVFHPLLISSGGAEQTYVHCIYLEKDNVIYVGTDKGIFVSYDRRNFSSIKGITTESCYDLEKYNGQLMAAINIYSIGCIINDSLQLPTHYNSQKMPYPAHSLSDLYLDRSGTLWAGAWDNHLHKFDHHQQIFTHINILNAPSIAYNDDEVVAIHETSPGLLWLGMKSFKIIAYHTTTGFTNPVSFSSSERACLNGRRIHFIYTDNEHRTWIGTDNGLHLRNPRAAHFNIYAIDEGATVTSFAEWNGQLFSTTTSGIYSINEQLNAIEKVSGDKPVRAFSAMSNGSELLVGTQSSIQRFRPKTGDFTRWTEQKNRFFDINAIMASRFSQLKEITMDGQRYLMAIPFGHGVIFGDLKNQHWTLCNLKTQNSIENLIRNIHQDQQGRLWVLGSSYGLTQVKGYYQEDLYKSISFGELFGQSNTTYFLDGESYFEGLLSKELTALVERADGRFWITTQGAGLYLFDPNQGKSNFESIPSPLQSMQNMIAGRNGDLWIVASGGLLNYEVERKTWRRFDNRDGIPKSGLSNAMYWSSKNRLLLGGNGFILSCDPNALSMSTEKPKPRLTHVAIMDEVMDSLLAHEKFTLAHDKNFISFAFTGLCFSDPKAVVYEYRLDGLDEDWRLNGNDNKVSYSDLSPGDYNFRVRIKSLKGEHSLEEAHIAFVIQAPFYLRLWFLAIVVGFAGVVIWLIQKAIRLQRSRINNVRNKIARDLHDDIGSALGSISFFSETAKRTLNSRNTEGTQNILDKIGTTSREMIENMHDIVWAVGSNNDGMQQMIERMKTYAADMVAMNDVQLHFEVDKEMVGLRLSMTERKNIFLVFKEAVYNSHKYAACQNIRVQMKRPKNDRLYLTVFDDGIGFDVTKKLESGNGLGNMKNRMAEIGARMVIQSEAEQGTRLEIWLP